MMMPLNSVIQIENLSKSFRCYSQPAQRIKQALLLNKRQYFQEFWALKNISLDIYQGETFGIVGKNGSGKSTLLQLICHILKPTQGLVHTQGRIAALLELGSGFNPEFTGRENIFMNGLILGLSKEEIQDYLEDIIQFANIDGFIDRPVKIYSSGMQLRLAFAVAVHVQPQILIVDEALAVGDELFQRKCYAKLHDIKEKGTTILFVSHSGAIVVELCDRALLLDAGDPIALGDPKQVVTQYQRLLFAAEDKKLLVREEILASSHNKTDIRPARLESSLPLNTDNLECQEFFDANLISESTKIYCPNGANIELMGIFTVQGKRVNYLHREQTYQYKYKVHFTQTANNVHFEMLIKTASGLVLGGGISASAFSQKIYSIEKDSSLEVAFNFKCNLNPGLYFLSCCVFGNNGEIVLHKIADITVFSVLPVQNNISLGSVYFDISYQAIEQYLEVQDVI